MAKTGKELYRDEANYAQNSFLLFLTDEPVAKKQQDTSTSPQGLCSQYM